jgi:hypothetical protein
LAWVTSKFTGFPRNEASIPTLELRRVDFLNGRTIVDWATVALGLDKPRRKSSFQYDPRQVSQAATVVHFCRKA